MNRDEKLQDLRPTLHIDGQQKKSLELFQNQTLRPILKFQQDLNLSLLIHHKHFQKPNITAQERNNFHQYITRFMQSNAELKNHILGTIIGLLTAEEIAFYMENRKEVTKRITQMQCKRFVDTFYGKMP